MNKQVFIFDMSGVLLDFDLETLKLKVTKDSNLTFDQVNQSWKNEQYIRSELGQISSKNYFESYSDKIGLCWSYAKWIDEWSNICSYNVKGMNLYKSLYNKRYSINILSNLAEYHKKAVEKKFPDFWRIADKIFFSYELNLLKPDPEIFNHVCSNLEVFPSDCFFFDDTIENVLKASEIGINAFQFSDVNYTLIIQWLRNNKVNVFQD